MAELPAAAVLLVHFGDALFDLVLIVLRQDHDEQPADGGAQKPKPRQHLGGIEKQQRQGRHHGAQ